MWLTPPRPYRTTTCQERELTLDHIRTFMTTLGHRGPPQMRNQLNAGAISEATQTWKTIHTIHAPIHSNKVNMKGWLWRPNDIQGRCGPKASRHLSYRWGETPKKFTQEICLDRGSNLGLLHNRHACYRLLHSGSPLQFLYLKIPNPLPMMWHEHSNKTHEFSFSDELTN